MKKSLVVLIALVVGFGEVSKLSAQRKGADSPAAEVVNVCVIAVPTGDPVTYTVPSDRRLTIEDATLQVFLRTGEAMYGGLIAPVNGAQLAHTVGYLRASDGNRYYSAARPIKAYADPGSIVYMRVIGLTLTTSASICFAGRLDPVQ